MGYFVSLDAEEDIPEEQRVKNALEKIRNESHDDGILAEIQLIKDRHRQLEVLTDTKQRAMAEGLKLKQSRKQVLSLQCLVC